MDMVLIRKDFKMDGVFGELRDENGNLIAVTLEHAYPNGAGKINPKVPSGIYTCKRGEHKLENAQPFETFEIEGVDGHYGILFHKGNFNRDSSGCVLLGAQRSTLPTGEHMITSSKTAFEFFLTQQEGCDSFKLNVI